MMHMSWKSRALLLAGLIVVAGILLYLFFGPANHPGGENARTDSSPDTAPANPHAGHGTPVPPEETTAKGLEEDLPTVEIPEDKQKLIGVKAATVKIQDMNKIIRTVGRIEYDERNVRTVNTKIEGWIEKLYVDYTGRYVRKGEPLAGLYSPELLASQQDLINLTKWKGQQNGDTVLGALIDRDHEDLINAARKRLRLWDISEEQIRQVEKTGEPLRTLIIRSPVSGYVVQKMALQGMRVMAGEKLFDIADLSTLWIIADIYEGDLADVRIGDLAKITLSYAPGKEIESRIEFVSPVFSGETRTAKVRFAIPNPSGQLKPQMFAQVEIKIRLGKRLVIPEAAVIDTGVRQVVYVDRGEGNFEPRTVLLGVRAEGYREVLKGLNVGEKVAATASFLIDSEAQLKGVQPLEAK
jgi:Cu(I)/Ag(I) efflux system membrane fusion protein